MYMIINGDLNMSTGKIAAQIGHAAHNIIEKYYNKTYSQQILDNYEMWYQNNQRIVILSGKEKKLLQIIKKYQDCCVIKDAGYTEVPVNALTVVAINPIERGSCNIIKRLRCL